MLPHAITPFAHAKFVLAIILSVLSTCSTGVVLAQTGTAEEVTNHAVKERAAPTTRPEQAGEPRKVLAVYWYGKDYPFNVVFDRHLQAALRSSPETVEYYAEYFESNRFPGEEQARILRDYLREKYESRIDVVLAVSPVALDFLLEYRADLFSSTPIVFYTSARPQVRPGTDIAALTGVSTPDAYEKTLDLALELHPDATQVFIVSGTPGREGLIEDEVREQLEGFESRADLEYLSDLPLDILLATLRSLPENSLILYARQSIDEPGGALSPIDFLNLIERAAPVPIYSPGPTYVGNGSVGGHVVDVEAGATKTAEVALRLARGAPAEGVPMARGPTVPTFDARQLKRWGIDEARLPAQSVILFRSPTVWAQYGGYVVSATIVFLMQSALIGALLVQRARRRRAEASLKKSEQRYELATTAARVGVWDWDMETNELYPDPALNRALGYAEREPDNLLTAWLRRVHPDDATRVMEQVGAHIEGKTEMYEAEYRMLHKDGRTRWFLTRGSLVRQPGTTSSRLLGTHTDITERKSAEAKLSETQTELARISRLTALGEFAASIAHEVNQPLTAILMDAQTSLRWIGTPSPPIEDIREALSNIVDAGNRANELIRRNRELFRHHTVEKLPLELDSIVQDVALLVRTRLESSQVKLETAFQPDLPAVIGDRVELQQVLLNLLMNGIDAMETTDPQLRRLRIDARLAAKGMVQIDVRDNGIGLDAVDFERLFQPSYTTKPTGTGVGLSISRSIVDAHGGKLWAKRNDGPGATFCFTIPAVAAPALCPRAAAL